MASAQRDNFNHLLTLGAMALVAVHFGVVAMLGFQPPKWGEDSIAAKPDLAAKPSIAPKPSLPLSLTPPPVDDAPSTKPVTIKPIYLATLPDLTGDSAEMRKQQFIAIILPLILRANQELLLRRTQVIEAIETDNSEALAQWRSLYDISGETASVDGLKDELMRRITPVPVSIALAQAAVESGWGTSRFARTGNALFGQWAWRTDAGLRPLEARYDNAVVRSFDSLFDSVRAYMHNLNSHFAYERFRDLRQQMADDAPSPQQINALAATLDRYSEEGADYVKKLQSVIAVNGLTAYDNAVLLPE